VLVKFVMVPAVVQESVGTVKLLIVAEIVQLILGHVKEEMVALVTNKFVEVWLLPTNVLIVALIEQFRFATERDVAVKFVACKLIEVSDSIVALVVTFRNPHMSEVIVPDVTRRFVLVWLVLVKLLIVAPVVHVILGIFALLAVMFVQVIDMKLLIVPLVQFKEAMEALVECKFVTYPLGFTSASTVIVSNIPYAFVASILL
jgi:hypothetical protein